MIKQAVIYARYSSDSQTEQSIKGQLRFCNEELKVKNTKQKNPRLTVRICFFGAENGI